MTKKLKFTLVPVSGALESSGSYRAKLGTKTDMVLGIDEVIKEAQADGSFPGVSAELLKLYVRGVLQSMIDHTAADGRTRRIDDYLSVALKLHGKFDDEDEDFDPDKHKLTLLIRPLAAFRTKFQVQPVNVNRKGEFRLYSITAADGLHKSGHVAWQQDFCIKGDDLLPEEGTVRVICQMKGPDGVALVVEPEIVSATAKKIVCHWPEKYGEGFSDGRMCVTVSKPDGVDEQHFLRYISREKLVVVDEV